MAPVRVLPSQSQSQLELELHHPVCLEVLQSKGEHPTMALHQQPLKQEKE